MSESAALTAWIATGTWVMAVMTIASVAISAGVAWKARADIDQRRRQYFALLLGEIDAFSNRIKLRANELEQIARRHFVKISNPNSEAEHEILGVIDEVRHKNKYIRAFINDCTQDEIHSVSIHEIDQKILDATKKKADATKLWDSLELLSIRMSN